MLHALSVAVIYCAIFLGGNGGVIFLITHLPEKAEKSSAGGKLVPKFLPA